jgi:hypothetical protein
MTSKEVPVDEFGEQGINLISAGIILHCIKHTRRSS